MNDYQSIYTLLLYFYISVYTTYYIIKNKKNKFLIILVWLLPFLGLILMSFLDKDKEIIKYKGSKILETKTTLKTVRFSGLIFSIFFYGLIYIFLGTIKT